MDTMMVVFRAETKDRALLFEAMRTYPVLCRNERAS